MRLSCSWLESPDCADRRVERPDHRARLVASRAGAELGGRPGQEDDIAGRGRDARGQDGEEQQMASHGHPLAVLTPHASAGSPRRVQAADTSLRDRTRARCRRDIDPVDEAGAAQQRVISVSPPLSGRQPSSRRWVIVNTRYSSLSRRCIRLWSPSLLPGYPSSPRPLSARRSTSP